MLQTYSSMSQIPRRKGSWTSRATNPQFWHFLREQSDTIVNIIRLSSPIAVLQCILMSLSNDKTMYEIVPIYKIYHICDDTRTLGPWNTLFDGKTHISMWKEEEGQDQACEPKLVRLLGLYYQVQHPCQYSEPNDPLPRVSHLRYASPRLQPPHDYSTFAVLSKDFAWCRRAVRSKRKAERTGVE